MTIEVIQEQLEAGLDLIADGQVRWDDDQTHIARGLEGFEIGGLVRYFDTNTYYRQPTVSGPVGWRKPVLVRDYEFAAAHSAKPVKAMLTGPYTLAALSTDSHYGDRRRLVLDLAQALHQEAQALAAAGAPFIQVNEPAIVQNKDDAPAPPRGDHGDAGRRPHARPRSTPGSRTRPASSPLLNDLPVDVIGLDFVWGPGNWDALKAGPFTKSLGFGIVDARNTRHGDRRRDRRADTRGSVELVPPERLHVNPSCGLEYLPREVAFEKLKRMVEGVRRAEAVAV